VWPPLPIRGRTEAPPPSVPDEDKPQPQPIPAEAPPPSGAGEDPPAPAWVPPDAEPAPGTWSGTLGLMATLSLLVLTLCAAFGLKITTDDDPDPTEDGVTRRADTAPAAACAGASHAVDTAPVGTRTDAPGTPVTIDSLTPLGERPPALAGVTVAAPDGSFAITLPPDWRAGFVDPDLPPVGQQMFPHDPDSRLQVASALSLCTPATRMLALVRAPSPDGSAPASAVLQIDGRDGVGDNLSPYGAVRLIENRSIGQFARITGEGTFDSASGPVGWVAFQASGSGLDAVRYLVTGGGWEWTATYWTSAIADGHMLGDQMAASLTPGPAGT
jgi:hypothetical protein